MRFRQEGCTYEARLKDTPRKHTPSIGCLNALSTASKALKVGTTIRVPATLLRGCGQQQTCLEGQLRHYLLGRLNSLRVPIR